MEGSLNLNLQTIIQNLKKDIERVNELFGTDISVDINPEALPQDRLEESNNDLVDGIEDRADDKIEDAVPDSEDANKTLDDVKEGDE